MAFLFRLFSLACIAMVNVAIENEETAAYFLNFIGDKRAKWGNKATAEKWIGLARYTAGYEKGKIFDESNFFDILLNTCGKETKENVKQGCVTLFGVKERKRGGQTVLTRNGYTPNTIEMYTVLKAIAEGSPQKGGKAVYEAPIFYVLHLCTEANVDNLDSIEKAIAVHRSQDPHHLLPTAQQFQAACKRLSPEDSDNGDKRAPN